MKKYITKSLCYFLTSKDEIRLENILIKAIPNLHFVDGAVWTSSNPPIISTFKECKSGVIYLWDSTVCPRLPFKEIAPGKIQGPSSGVVIQFIRSRETEFLLLSGDMGIGYEKENESMRTFVNVVFKIVKSLNAVEIASFEKETGIISPEKVREYVVGEDVKNFCNRGGILKHYAADIYYRSC